MPIPEKRHTINSIKNGVWFHENHEDYNFKIELLPFSSSYRNPLITSNKHSLILTSAVDSFGCRFCFWLKVMSTWTEAFRLVKVFIVCELLVMVSRRENMCAAFSSGKPSPLSTICNNSHDLWVMCQNISRQLFYF